MGPDRDVGVLGKESGDDQEHVAGRRRSSMYAGCVSKVFGVGGDDEMRHTGALVYGRNVLRKATVR